MTSIEQPERERLELLLADNPGQVEWAGLALPRCAPDHAGLTGDWHFWEHERALIRRGDEKRYVAVLPFMYTFGLVWGWLGDTTGYVDRWCYEKLTVAVVAGYHWDGHGDPPDGWHRHPVSGRRRPDGDPAREHVSL